MSTTDSLQHTESTSHQGCEAIRFIIVPREKDLGEFTVRRLLPFARQRMVGPWIFFDHMGPADFPAGNGVNVRPHPHINLATVTYLFEGEILHRDSLGSEQLIRPGDINLMVAGRGITHSERERQQVHRAAHRTHGLQLWHALPEAEEECDPAFYHYPAETLPTLEVDGAAVRVMVGNAYGVTSPVKTFAETLYIEARLSAGQSLRLPNAPERGLYVVEGELRARDTVISATQMAVFESQEGVEVTALHDSLIALIGGEPLGERHIYWNFVSSRKERIEQAKADWQAGRFPTVPGDDEEHIPLPDA